MRVMMPMSQHPRNARLTKMKAFLPKKPKLMLMNLLIQDQMERPKTYSLVVSAGLLMMMRCIMNLAHLVIFLDVVLFTTEILANPRGKFTFN
jgi:hypothetical protein